MGLQPLLVECVDSNPAAEEQISVSCECCMLSGRGLSDGPITHPEKGYRVWFIQMSAIEETLRGGLSPVWAVEPWNKNSSFL